MKNVAVLSSATSAKSTTTTASIEEEYRDSSCYYYPGCRKDANCSCEMCLASINATLDLVPMSSLSKLSTASRPNPKVAVTPISFSASSLSTPRSDTPRTPVSPRLRSSARTNLKEKKLRRKERQWGCGSDFLRLFGVFSLIFMAEFGFFGIVSEVSKPVFTPDMVRNLGEKSSAVKDLKGKLRFLQKSLQGVVDLDKVSNCSYANSRWEISQDALLLSSHCKLYKSSREEIRIWGWPLQTAGLLTTGFSTRSFTIVSGRVTEWSDGKVGYVIRKANSSWAHQKWRSSAIQFDPNTWILEYRRSSILENPRLVSAALSILKYRVSRIVGQMKHDLWLFSAFESYQHHNFAAERAVQVPT
ncbi:uncharacterized protein LOC133819159 [Humulus lupulus]|uniref:uncharacterized protein LOC133819159 n=1 Tax=Humulus lupulus TaxID=3486 RepID=UPI002B40A2DF|nr:uncharacterized protein LOC133819159 [Humulus lupulus]